MERPVKNYVVIGDWVHSPTDGDQHYISPRHLAQLYSLPESECIFVDLDRNEGVKGMPRDLPRFYPRWDGKYEPYDGRPYLQKPAVS